MHKELSATQKSAKVSEETIRKILIEVRKRRRKRANQNSEIKEEEEEATITSRVPD